MSNTTSDVIQRPRATKPPANPQPVNVSETALRGLVEVFQMLADPSRLRILLALARCGEMHVTALCQTLGQSQPAVSHHLAQLRTRRLVSVRRDGKNNFYCVDSAPLRGLLQQLFEDGREGERQFELDGFCVAFSCR